MTITDQHLAAYIEAIFSKYDRDLSGTLESSELTAFFNDVYRAMGRNINISPQQAQQALGIMDSDHNGRLSREELFNAFKQILVKEGFFVNNQNVYTNTGHSYNQAIDQWRVSQQMGNTLPYFGQTLNYNVNQYGGNQMAYSQGNSQYNQYPNPYQSQFQQPQNPFAAQQPAVNPSQPQNIQQLQQQQLNQMIAMQNQINAQHQQSVLEAQKVQLEMHKAQIDAQLFQMKMHSDLVAVQQQFLTQQNQQPNYGFGQQNYQQGQFGYGQGQTQPQNFNNGNQFGYGGTF